MEAGSITPLTLVMYPRAIGATVAIIARVVALEVSESACRLSIAAHGPGAVNFAAGASTGAFALAVATLPTWLDGVVKVSPAPRGRSWFRTLALPPVLQMVSSA